METLTALKVAHIVATVLLLISALGLAGLGLACAAQRRCDGPRSHVAAAAGVRLGVDGAGIAEHAVHRVVDGASGGLAAGADLVAGFECAVHRGGVGVVLAAGAAEQVAQGAGRRRQVHLCPGAVQLCLFYRDCRVDGRQASVGASLLAKNSRSPRGVRCPALSLTTIASKLAPTRLLRGMIAFHQRSLWERACPRRRHQSRRLITGQPRFSASARKFGSGSTATGFATCSSNDKSFIESL